MLACSNDSSDNGIDQENDIEKIRDSFLGTYNGSIECEGELIQLRDESITFEVEKGAASNLFIVYTTWFNQTRVYHNSKLVDGKLLFEDVASNYTFEHLDENASFQCTFYLEKNGKELSGSDSSFILYTVGDSWTDLCEIQLIKM